jgi:hypothetical protein
MTLWCKNHGLVEASHVSDMPSAERPYKVTVPLCTPCALRTQKIGLPVQALWADDADV